ncbi:hypothetical protein PV04_04529 [Phialophora macrospora]|uniref:Fungal N-terminal domain-containing protein n=1 Tax=Phialophora macrospora TaxID=1851006 RepID=A0A0D2CTS8_9EURO|nr:hypothetical protein PV04_04529 [Phialophora macrospora]
MAEAAAVASIVGIASFGIQLTKALYEFGCNVSSARDEANYIARHVDLYANVLDVLTERIDDDEPILSDAAFDLIDELQCQSKQIFTKIEYLLPVPKEGKDDISFLQKVKWNFTKSRVALLVGELDYLRSTVQLLVTIIFTGKKLRSHRRRVKSDKNGSSAHDSDLRRQQIKAQNALLAQNEAQERLLVLEEQVAQQERTLGIDTGKSCAEPSPVQMDIVSTTATTLADLTRSLAVYTDPAERQQIFLRHSGQVLQQLLQQWTNIGFSASDTTSHEAEIPSATHPNHSATRDVTEHSSAENVNLTRSSTHDVVNGTHIGIRPTDIRSESQPLFEELEASASSRENIPSGRVREKVSRAATSHPPEWPPIVTETLAPGTIKRWNPMTRRYCYFADDGRMIKCDCRLPTGVILSPGSTKHWDSRAQIYKYFNANGVEISAKTISILSQFDGLFSLQPANNERPVKSRSRRTSHYHTRRTEVDDGEEADEEEGIKRHVRERELKPQRERRDDLHLRPANTEQKYSDRSRTTTATRTNISTNTNICQACNGLGGREDKFRVCRTCTSGCSKSAARTVEAGGRQ